MAWDPDLYARFADHRLRPGVDLIAALAGLQPTRVIDLGCGTGTLTGLLASRFPAATVQGVDSDEHMLTAARARFPTLDWLAADIGSWAPAAAPDLIFSNSALHWLPAHDRLFPRLFALLAPGGTLAVQMPDNWDQPTHTVPARLLRSPRWRWAAKAMMAPLPADPEQYRDWLAAVSGHPEAVTIWRTTYRHVLEGPDPVLAWTSGTILRPVLEALGDQREEFAAEVAAGYRDAYPPRPDGLTVLPFSRLFVVARR